MVHKEISVQKCFSESGIANFFMAPLLDSSEDPCVEVDKSRDRDDAGEDKPAPVLVIADNMENVDDEVQEEDLTECNLGLS